MQESQRSRSAVQALTSCRVQASFHVLSVTLEWAATATFCNGCKHWVHKKCSGLKHLSKDSDYRMMYLVPGNCTPLGRQTTVGRPSRTWQAGGGSFLLLPGRHALSSWWLWTFDYNMCVNRLEEVQGASSLFMPPLFQDTWPCVHLLCVECNAPYKWD